MDFQQFDTSGYDYRDLPDPSNKNATISLNDHDNDESQIVEETNININDDHSKNGNDDNGTYNEFSIKMSIPPLSELTSLYTDHSDTTNNSDMINSNPVTNIKPTSKRKFRFKPEFDKMFLSKILELEPFSARYGETNKMWEYFSNEFYKSLIEEFENNSNNNSNDNPQNIVKPYYRLCQDHFNELLSQVHSHNEKKLNNSSNNNGNIINYKGKGSKSSKMEQLFNDPEIVQLVAQIDEVRKQRKVESERAKEEQKSKFSKYSNSKSKPVQIPSYLLHTQSQAQLQSSINVTDSNTNSIISDIAYPVSKKQKLYDPNLNIHKTNTIPSSFQNIDFDTNLVSPNINSSPSLKTNSINNDSSIINNKINDFISQQNNPSPIIVDKLNEILKNQTSLLTNLSRINDEIFEKQNEKFIKTINIITQNFNTTLREFSEFQEERLQRQSEIIKESVSLIIDNKLKEYSIEKHNIDHDDFSP